MDQTRRSRLRALAAVVGAVLMSMLVGCSIPGQTVEVAKLGPATQVSIYEDGRPVSERVIAAGSEEDRIIEAWLRSHPDGWRTDRNSYAPHRNVKGHNFTLNFQRDRCILNYRREDGGRWIQVSRPIRGDDSVPAIFANPQ
jgi:hypothetical protein